jgi:hypothetical protein
MRGLWVVWLAANAWAQLPKSQLDLQREGAKTLEPAEIELRQNAAERETRILKLRVYATRDYRAQTFDWSARFSRIIARVNRALARWPNVRLEVVDVRRWEQDSAVPLGRLLQQLEAADPGRDVDFVVGLAVAVPTLPEQIHNLGMAREMGRHFVVRSLHDLAEYEVVRGAFDQMSPVERERLIGLRKAHKEVVVFLHEMMHALGLIHAQRWQRIMNPTYHHGQSQLSDTEAHMLELGLERPADWRARLARLVEREPDPDWDPRDRDGLRALLAGTVPSPPGMARQEPGHELDECKKAAEKPGPTLDAVCGRAAAESHGDVWAYLYWAQGAIGQHYDARADELLLQAEPRLNTPESYGKAAELRRALNEPTSALEYAARAGQAKETAEYEAWAQKTRKDWMLPEGAGLPPAREGEYVRLVRLALQALDGGQMGAAEMLVRQIGDKFPTLPAAKRLRERLNASAPGSRRH